MLRNSREAEPTIRALWDRGEPSPTYIYRRGDFLSPGRLVGPGVPSVLTDGKTPLRSGRPGEAPRLTGRRLAFALADSSRPPLNRACHRQSCLETSLRHGSGDHPRQLRQSWGRSHPPGIARLARRRIHGTRLESQGPSSVDGHVGNLPTILARERLGPKSRLGQHAPLAPCAASDGGRNAPGYAALGCRSSRRDAIRTS